MADIDNPAFPVPSSRGRLSGNDGLTKLEYASIHILQGLLIGCLNDTWTKADIEAWKPIAVEFALSYAKSLVEAANPPEAEE